MIMKMNHDGIIPISCDACRTKIMEKHYIMVGAKTRLHYKCLRCSSCQCSLSTAQTCYEKMEKIFCKNCYLIIWSKTKCQRCQRGISNTDLVMQAHKCYYHVECFACYSCGIHLKKGQRFGVKDQKVYCELHYKQIRLPATLPVNDTNNNIGTREKLDRRYSMPSLSQHFNVKDEPCRSLSPLTTQTPFPQQKQQHQQQQQQILDISNHRTPILRQLSDPSNIHSSDNKTTELKPISSSLNFSDHLPEPLGTNLSPKTFTSKKIDNQLKPLSSSLNFSDHFPDPLVTNSSPKTFTSTKEIDNKLNDPVINIQQNQWKVNKPQSFADTYTSFPFNFPNTSGHPRKPPNSSHSGSADSSFSLKRHQSSEPLVSPVLQKKFLPEPSVKLSESQTLQSPMSSISSYFQNLGKNSAPDCKPFLSLEKHKEDSNNDMKTFTNLFTEKNERETKSFINLDVKKQIASSDIEITTNPSSSKTSHVDIPSYRKPPPAYSDFQPLTFSDNEPENDKFQDQTESQDTKGSDSNDFPTIKTGSNSSSSDEDGSQEPKKATKVTSTKSRKSRSKDNKPKRQRTSFKVYQLVAMKELFDCDKNPDSIKLTRLADKIDLPKRVLQVWFQNARAKHRKGQNIFSDTIEKMLLPENVGKALEKESQGDENEDCVEDQSLEFDDETNDPTDDVS